jgi:hypothetical protein
VLRRKNSEKIHKENISENQFKATLKAIKQFYSENIKGSGIFFVEGREL